MGRGKEGFKPELKELLQRHDSFNVKRYKRPISDAELLARLALMPREDARDLTGRLMGDPIPGDQRRQPCNEKENVNCVEELV